MNFKKKYKKAIIAIFLLIVVCLLTIPFVASCSSEIEGVNATAIINLIFPNIWVFIATIASTVVLLSCIIWFLWKPMNKKLETIRKHVTSEIFDAENAKKEAFELKESARENLLNAQLDASKIVQDANDRANVIYQELQTQAHKDADQIIKDAQEQIALERKELEQQTHNEILDVAFEAVTKISKQKITREENNKLVEEFLKDFQDSKD